MKPPKINHLLGIEELDKSVIRLFLDKGRQYQAELTSGERTFSLLKGKTVVSLFYEPSTRTQSSFQIAAKRLGADFVSITAGLATSVSKGENLLDTAKTLVAMNPDFLVLRHGSSGAPQLLAKKLNIPIINAGDGFHEHPTQALLDALTIEEHYKNLRGLEVSIIGDIVHSRVARSNIYLLNKLGAKITVCGPPTLVPFLAEQLNVCVTHKLEEALKKADVVMVLRIQYERQNKQQIPSNSEYYRFFGIHRDSQKLLKKNAIIMHPGPMNPGVEISQEIASSDRSVIFHQVTNGVALRMGVLDVLNAARKER